MEEKKFINREISWLSFNYRVLQEAKDKTVPVFEKIKFMAIFSSNLDEFFRVRVASLRSLLVLKKKTREKLKFNPAKLLEEIHSVVNEHQEEFGEIYRNGIQPELESNNIFIIDEKDLCLEHINYISEYFNDNILHQLQPVLIVKDKIKPFLQNRKLYFAVRLKSKESDSNSEKKKTHHKYAIVEIPSEKLPRFIILPELSGKNYIIFLDDIIRYFLPQLFKGYMVVSAFSIKLTRDADLYIDNEFSGDLLNKIKKGLKKRDTGIPSRFLYDKNIPDDFLKFLREALGLEKEDLVPGGRYHNFSDFFAFPSEELAQNINKNLQDVPLPALPENSFDKYPDKFSAVSDGDIMIHFPYQDYNYVIDFFNAAAEDPFVTSIKITQYRVAKQSGIVEAMIKAVKNGKSVIVFVEVKARFDEESNIYWAEAMEKAGVKVYYSFPGLKVHAKIALINRNEDGKDKRYCYLSTGNFNENNAKLYTDIGFFTADKHLTEEVSLVFDILESKIKEQKFKHLLVAQFNMRKKFNKLINNEITQAKLGKPAGITLKLNSLEDRKIIRKLYEAGNAGVKIDIICRGICCLEPGVKGSSENIRVISIIDRFLEHSRIYIFHNEGKKLFFAGSADWMKRNLSRRIEVIFPVYEKKLKKELKRIIDLQLNDNSKARIIERENSNEYRKDSNQKRLRSQLEIYRILKEKDYIREKIHNNTNTDDFLINP